MTDFRVTRPQPTRCRLLKSALAAACSLALATAAAAENHRFNILGGDLEAALDAYAQQSGVRLIYLSDEVRGASSRGVSGEMSEEAALDQLLHGTGFVIRRDPTGAIAVVRAPSETSASADITSVETVLVTGSHIRGAQLSGVGPVSVIDAETIQSSGAVSVETLLQRLPSSAGAAGSQSNNFWTGNGNGTTQVNLRGLGVNRTLVLLNGRRVVNGGTGANNSVDLNIVPIALIERIEILKDGASAIYGADAVAGVVNIITKQEMNGVQATARYGQTFRGDGDVRSADLAWGRSDESLTLLGSVNYSESGTVTMTSRAPCPLGVVAGRLECVGNSSTIGGRARLADGTMVNFNQDPNGNPSFYEPYSPARHNYNYNPTLNAVSPIQRLGANAFGRIGLSDDASLFTEMMFTHRESSQRASPNSLGLYRPIRIAAGHPTNPTGQNLVLERRRIEEAGPRQTRQEVETLRTVVGAEGTFASDWNWSVALNWGRNSATDTSTNIANNDRVENTLNTALCSNTPGAAIPCGNYLGYGNLTPEVLDYILFTQRGTGGNQQQSFTSTVSGHVLELAAGRMSFASGVEIREEKGWIYPDTLVVNGSANIVRQDPIDGKYLAKEAFAELSIPLLRDVILADALTLNTAVRYSNYDLFGSDTNYKLGLDWQVIPSLKARVNYATAFRIPSIPELFGGIGQGSLTTLDPCSNWSALPADSIVRANCQAHGVPVNYRQLGNTILTTTGGNEDLKPEDAKTLTAGLVWTPGFVRGLTLTADYFDIRIDNAIRSIEGAVKLNACYTTPGLSHPFCSSSNFTRDPVTGEIDYLSSRQVNAASERAKGVDIGGLYEFGLAGMRFTVSADTSYLRQYDVTPFQNARTISYAGKITSGLGSFTQWRAFSSLKLQKNAWSGTYSAQYVGPADDIAAQPGTIGSRASGIFYHNLQFGYALAQSLDVSVGVENLFDEKAPFIQNNPNANTDTMTYDLLGRRWNVRFGYQW